MPYHKVVKKEMPIKLARKAMLSSIVIRSYAKDKNFLSDAMVMKLREHSKIHTIRHIRSMINKMEKGMTFSKAHSETMKKYGK
jgi:CO dehydrogenase/acetyl-CoA synthase epsilon subunit